MRVNAALRRVDGRIQAGATPQQRAYKLGEYLPALKPEIVALSNDYQSRLYGLQASTAGESTRAIEVKVWLQSQIVATRQNIRKAAIWLKKQLPKLGRKG